MAVGKDEVPSSNLGSSSNAIPWNHSDPKGFCYVGEKFPLIFSLTGRKPV